MMIHTNTEERIRQIAPAHATRFQLDLSNEAAVTVEVVIVTSRMRPRAIISTTTGSYYYCYYY